MFDWEDDIFTILIYIAAGILGLTICIAFKSCTLKAENKYEATLKDIDYNTNYDSVREIEETLRSFMASYEADKIIYETNKNATDKESIALANAARSRANRTAATYNQFYLKNSYIWEDNIPADIRSQLEYIQ